MKILALDLAKNKSVSLMNDTQTGEEEYETIRSTPADVERLLQKHRPDRVVLEIGASAGWVHDLAVSMGIAVGVANPNGEAWRWAGVKAKSDRKDVDKMMSLSLMSRLPLVHMPSPQVRQKRALIAYLRNLVDRRTAIKNQIHAILDRQGLSCASGKKTWTQESLKRLAAFVNGGAKVQRAAGQKCSAQPLSTPPNAGCQLRKLLFNSLAHLESLPESLAC